MLVMIIADTVKTLLKAEALKAVKYNEECCFEQKEQEELSHECR